MSDAVFRTEAAAAEVAVEYRQVLDRWPVSRSERRIATREGETFVVVSGPEDGPAVVLLHGSQANAAAWIPDVPLWASKFRLYAIDMIGEPGLSARVQPDLATDAHALWLDEVFDGLGLSTFAVVGTSLGGWLALDYANRRPGRVSALVLICPSGIGRQKNFLLEIAPLLFLGPWGQRKIREKVFGPPPRELPDGIRLIGRLMDIIGRGVKPRVFTIPRLTDDQLGRLKMPILAIMGGRDVLLDSYDTRDRLSHAAPHAEISFIADGRHFLPGQAPRVMDFLERCALRPSP